jgi:MFS family permease
MVLKSHESHDLNFDELSVASYENNNHQLSSLDIDDDKKSLPNDIATSSDNSEYESSDHGNTSPLHDRSDGNNNHYRQRHQLDQSMQDKATNLPLLSACYMSALTTGATTYAFSFYSNALKSSLHLTQNQLDTLSSAIFCAGILSWIPGMIVDAFGARSAMILGGTGNTIHLFCYWMIVTERWNISNINTLIGVLSVLGVLIFVGCALVTGSVFKVIVESCGKGTKGKAVGCAKGYVGVGSGVYVCLFGALFGRSGGSSSGGGGPALMTLMIPPSSSTVLLSDNVPQSPELNSLNFLIMASGLSFLAAVLPALCLLPKKKSLRGVSRDGTRGIHFRVIYAGMIMLGIWVVGVSLAEIEEEKIDGMHNGGSSDGDDGSVTPSDSSNETSPTVSIVSSEYALADDEQISSSSYVTTIWNVARRELLSQSSAPEHHWGAAFLLLLLWWGPALSLLVIPPRKEGTNHGGGVVGIDRNANAHEFNYDDDDGNNDDNDEDEEETFLQDDVPVSRSRRYRKNPDSDDRSDNNGASERNYTLLEMLSTSSAWLMAWTCVILVGGGTVMTNNIGQMTEALGFDADLTPASLALFSAAQAASRVITGAVSEAALSWKLPWFCGYLSSSGGKGLARPAFLVVASIVSAAAHFSLAVATTEEGFALGVTLSGIAFGMVWPLMVLITGEVFGTHHVGANYMFFDGFSSAAGTLLLSKFVAQTVYDDHINEGHGDPNVTPASDSEFKCFGTECFRLSHVIVSLLSLTCILSSVGLIWTTRNVYRRS